MFGRGIELPLLLAAFSVVMLVRNLPAARQRRTVPIFTCLLSLLVLAAAVRAVVRGL